MQISAYKNISTSARVLLATAFWIYLASCGPSMKTYKLYQGPQRASNETAQLVCKGERVQLISVNGQKSPNGKETFGNVTLEILPGEYNLTVSFSSRSWTTVFGNSYNYQIFFINNSLHNVDTTMKAKAGHTYLITSDYNYDKNQWHAVIKDETADKIILKEGPYPLNKIRIGDNQAARRIYRNN